MADESSPATPSGSSPVPPGRGWMVVAALCGLAVAGFVLQQLATPVEPDTDRWTLVPVASHAMPEVRQDPGALSPGLRLDGYLQIIARLQDPGALGDGRLRFQTDLGVESSLHVFFRARDLDQRHRLAGYALFLIPSDAERTGLYVLGGDELDRIDCPWEGPVPRRSDLEIRLDGPSIEVLVDGTPALTCADGSFADGAVGFRSGMSPITLAAIQVEDADGATLFRDRPERFQASLALQGLIGAAVIVGYAALLWVLGWITARATRRDHRAGIRDAAWVCLPLLALPILGAMELGTIADGLRLGRTPLLAIRLVLVGLPAALFWGVVLLARAPALRIDREKESESLRTLLLSTRLGRVTLAAVGLHALLMSNLAWSYGAGVLASLGMETGRSADAAVTFVVLLGLPLGLLALAARLTRGDQVPLVRVELLSWLPSLLAAGIAIGALAAGSSLRWPVTFHIAAAVLASGTLKFLFVQANARAFRGYNWVSLLGCLALVLLAEGSVRQTYLNLAWDPVPADRFQKHPLLGWVRASNEFDYILNVQEHTDYPMERFPVAFDRGGGGQGLRVVCLGGSSTGGAYQMDDLEQFYPAVLGRVFDELASDAGVRVINQGVGGWNSFHCLLYLREFIDELDPDLITLYLGNNDIKTKGPWTYREYWENYRSRSASVSALQGLLNRSRMYVGFKSVLLMATGSPREVSAVPTPDAVANYAEIMDMAQERDARVLLMSEAILPLPEDIDDYYAAMRELAEERDEFYVDVASAFQARSHEDLFLDSNHLSAFGHQVLAEIMGEFMVAEGLVAVDVPVNSAKALIPEIRTGARPDIASHLGPAPGPGGGGGPGPGGAPGGEGVPPGGHGDQVAPHLNAPPGAPAPSPSSGPVEGQPPAGGQEPAPARTPPGP